VLDVGGHFGETGVYLRRLGFRGLIVSFEPVAASFQRLSERARRDGRWLTYQLAAGACGGSMALNVMADSELSSFRPLNRQGNTFFAGAAETGTQDAVRVVRLDDFVEAELPHLLSQRLFLKLDTQGWDLEAARGAERLLPAVMALQTEMAVRPLYEGAPRFTESLAHFEARGFEVAVMSPVSIDFATASLVEFDCVMVRTAPCVVGDEAPGLNAERGNEFV
jgi:FkbM family methyltransferase